MNLTKTEFPEVVVWLLTDRQYQYGYLEVLDEKNLNRWCDYKLTMRSDLKHTYINLRRTLKPELRKALGEALTRTSGGDMTVEYKHANGCRQLIQFSKDSYDPTVLDAYVQTLYGTMEYLTVKKELDQEFKKFWVRLNQNFVKNLRRICQNLEWSLETKACIEARTEERQQLEAQKKELQLQLRLIDGRDLEIAKEIAGLKRADIENHLLASELPPLIQSLVLDQVHF